MTIKELCKELEEIIINGYQSSITLDEAERYAGRFLHAQMQVSEHLKAADLNARMRKSGLKAIKASVYLDTCAKSDKKPTEAMIEATIAQTTIVNTEQDGLDTAEVEKADLERYYDIFREAHVYFRQMSKGVQG